ncbi:predicted protein [Coccidioides posadasii str. Silveira]|uniref:Predicted protein n=2 Tax=Coccidioides posadasii TaxID=199306 RepID=E9CV05_COCPS|nr:predicted protein [Coccidioides posadasii str. Silveira]KMM71604.1 hypothetical protein CPAG_07907 [Coccidioides posadasii RMSCC 3488]
MSGKVVALVLESPQRASQLVHRSTVKSSSADLSIKDVVQAEKANVPPQTKNYQTRDSLSWSSKRIGNDEGVLMIPNPPIYHQRILISYFLRSIQSRPPISSDSYTGMNPLICIHCDGENEHRRADMSKTSL